MFLYCFVLSLITLRLLQSDVYLIAKSALQVLGLTLQGEGTGRSSYLDMCLKHHAPLALKMLFSPPTLLPPRPPHFSVVPAPLICVCTQRCIIWSNQSGKTWPFSSFVEATPIIFSVRYIKTSKFLQEYMTSQIYWIPVIFNGCRRSLIVLCLCMCVRAHTCTGAVGKE